MAAPTQGAVRLLRAAALGGASTLLAALAHASGGGRLPGLGALALLAVPVGAVALLVTARRCRLPLLVGVLGLEQLVLHRLLNLFTAADCLTATGGHHAHVVAVGSCGPGSAAMAMPTSTPMLLAHVVATAATAWLLARGERLVWRLAERVLRPRRPGAATAPATAPTVAVVAAVARPVRVDLDHRARPRAPPVALRSATG